MGRRFRPLTSKEGRRDNAGDLDGDLGLDLVGESEATASPTRRRRVTSGDGAGDTRPLPWPGQLWRRRRSLSGLDPGVVGAGGAGGAAVTAVTAVAANSL